MALSIQSRSTNDVGTVDKSVRFPLQWQFLGVDPVTGNSQLATSSAKDTLLPISTLNTNPTRPEVCLLSASAPQPPRCIVVRISKRRSDMHRLLAIVQRSINAFCKNHREIGFFQSSPSSLAMMRLSACSILEQCFQMMVALPGSVIKQRDRFILRGACLCFEGLAGLQTSSYICWISQSWSLTHCLSCSICFSTDFRLGICLRRHQFCSCGSWWIIFGESDVWVSVHGRAG